MGNNQSSDTPKKDEGKQVIESVKEDVIKEDVEKELFNKILTVSSLLLKEYRENFLDEGFCNKLAIIYEKKLANFSLKVLRNMNDKISEDEIDNDLLIVEQKIPEIDEKFFVDSFKTQIQEYFWNHNIKFDKSIFEENKLLNDIYDISKLDNFNTFQTRYINKAHVNNLLRMLDTNTNVQQGGRNGENNNENENENENENNNNENNNENNNNEENNENENENVNNNSVNKTVNKSVNKSVNKTVNKSVSKTVNKSVSKSVISSNNNFRKEIEDQINYSKTEEKINRVNKELPKNKSVLPRSIIINEVVNRSVLSNVNKNKNNNNKNIKKPLDEDVSKFLKYYVPKYYTEPLNICKDQESCKLTKKEICHAISENFIVRGNIIAAILTTIPIQKSDGTFEGGILYQKFQNLAKCNVCVPENYKDLLKSELRDIIPEIVKYSEHLNRADCRNNNGNFLSLSSLEQYALKERIGTDKFNGLYIKYSLKLKDTYFNNLNLLLEILEKLRVEPIINNATLNSIAEQTKRIIDTMYNLCHYYYVFAIIALINSDVKPITDDKGKLAEQLGKSFEEVK
jgi:hypothetical protein